MRLIRTVCAIAAASLCSGMAFAQDRHRDDRNDVRQDVRHDERRDGPGAGPDHRFYRGGRLPDDYRGRQYVVDDWRGHHLNPPPRGYHWVQTGGDYVLAAIATGVIASVILNSR